MVAKPFDEFMQEIGAVKSERISTPFALYEIKEQATLFHYIDLGRYKACQPGIDFLPSVFAASQQLNLKVITIWEDVWQKRRDLVQSRILAMVGQRQRIHARQTSVIRLDKPTAGSFLDQNHMQGSTSAYYKFGLEFNDELVAVATFSKARTMYDGPVYYKSYELERFASGCGITVTGGLGKLLNHFMREVNAKHIMTYADADWGTGEGYIKLGFNLIGLSPPYQFTIDAKGNRNPIWHTEKSTNGQNDKDLLTIANTGSLKFTLSA